MSDDADGTGWQHAPVDLHCQDLRVTFGGQIERWFLRVSRCNGAGGVGAIGGDPALHQPLRRIERDRIESCKQSSAFARHAAEYGIDELGVTRVAAIVLREAYG